MRIACPISPRRRIIAMAAVLLVAAVGLGLGFALHGGASRVLWRGVTVPGHLAAHYRYFDGTDGRPVRAEAGDSLQLTYDLQPARGTLALEVVAPDGRTVWQRDASDPTQGSVTLVLGTAGRYQVQLRGQATRGSFDVRYRAVPASAG